MATTTYIYNNSDIETVQPASSCNQFAHEVEDISLRFNLRNLRRLTAPRIYRRQLKMYRKVAQWSERHSVIVNALMAAQVAAFIVYTFLYY